MKTALVLGVDTSAIARAIWSDLDSQGYELIAVAERQDYSFDLLGKHRMETVDLSSETDTTDLIRRLKSTGQYDLVVHAVSALAIHQRGSIRLESRDFSIHEFNHVLQRNLTSSAAVTLGLQENYRPRASVINVTSSAAFEGAFATISYNASKAALHNLTKSLANILGPRGVRANCIAPGWIPPSVDAAAGGTVAVADALTPTRTTGTVEHVVLAANYLISNGFQNGSILEIDGGISSSYLPYMLEAAELSGSVTGDEVGVIAGKLRHIKDELFRTQPCL